MYKFQFIAPLKTELVALPERQRRYAAQYGFSRGEAGRPTGLTDVECGR
jgi:hypothetical protein